MLDLTVRSVTILTANRSNLIRGAGISSNPTQGGCTEAGCTSQTGYDCTDGCAPSTGPSDCTVTGTCTNTASC